jgi:hypothetical protein
MYLRDLHIRNLRLIHDLRLSFAGDGWTPRMWTVLIGRNGTGKTSILQAIALAAVGHLRANLLAGATSVSMPDRRHPAEELHIDATFGFGPLGDNPHRRRVYPGYPGTSVRGAVGLYSSLSMSPGSVDLVGRSRYEQGNLLEVLEDREPLDPLQKARSEELPHWFVAGYGVSRYLATGDHDREVGKPSHDRLVPLFRPTPLIGLGFADLFAEKAAKRFTKILRQVLTTAEDLVPDIRDVETGGRGGIKKAADLYDRDRFEQTLPSGSIKLPATWLSHGYQASLAWLADLVGHYLLDFGGETSIEVQPEYMEGLVLIDELDLYLHPTWQAGLVRALKITFPRMQFVVTTHSPILLNALTPDEVVTLYLDDEGNVQAQHGAQDPRLLTGTELYSQFFGIDRLYPSELGDKLDRYSHLAVDPFRSDREDEEVRRLGQELRNEGIELTLEPVPREHEG